MESVSLPLLIATVLVGFGTTIFILSLTPKRQNRNTFIIIFAIYFIVLIIVIVATVLNSQADPSSLIREGSAMEIIPKNSQLKPNLIIVKL